MAAGSRWTLGRDRQHHGGVTRTLEASAYDRIERLIAAEAPVIIDGGMATELQRSGLAAPADVAVDLWGAWSLARTPGAVLDVHRSYVAAGVDVLSTDTWALLDAQGLESRLPAGREGTSHWLELGRQGLALARQSIAEAGRTGEVAVAFSLNGDIASQEQLESLKLLARVLERDRPDLILLETMSLIRDGVTMPAVETALATGLPVWLSFRRCRRGACGIYGQHWGGPEGDSFGRAARRFEELGVGALLVNCLPTDHVPGMLPWLRDFTDLPLGVYPNLGHRSATGWRFDDSVSPEAFAELALAWRGEGAQIVGGCCGTSPQHIAAARTRVAGTHPGRPRSGIEGAAIGTQDVPTGPEPTTAPAAASWTDEGGRSLYPLRFPDLVPERGVFQPTMGSLLVWSYLFSSGLGRDKSCIDVGCGSGVQAIQLALNGATSVYAVDVEPRAIASTMANAYRNGVAERVTAETLDLYHLVPDRRFDVLVASLYQMPVDPFTSSDDTRPRDYWGRNMVDHLLRLLPRLLEVGGRAYVMQLSILSRARTDEILAELGLVARVVDYSFLPFNEVLEQNRAQVERVEQLSDAFHITIGTQDLAVAYLLEVRRRDEVLPEPA
jgi:S-methylmethionine-dependent homocysteine/selenocysteine methylase/SAM-dependent methyltransferase